MSFVRGAENSPKKGREGKREKGEGREERKKDLEFNPVI